MSGNIGGCKGEDDDFEFFLRWASERGISDQRFTASSQPTEPSSCLGQTLAIAYFPEAGGRGLAATRYTMRGEMVLKVPRSALLTKENVIRDEKIAACIARHSRLTATQILTVCLLVEAGKGKGSLWYPYLTQLPLSYNLLASFKPSEIRTFQVDYAIEVSDEAVSKSQSDWKQATVLMQELGLSPRLQTFQSWLWAFATVSSRALHVPWDNAGCLCPVGDLFNYDAPGKYLSKDPAERSSVSVRLTDGGFEDDINSYCFYARRNYQKGEQVLLCYGTYTNLELLEHYGFLLDTNPNDKIHLKLDPAIYTCSSWPKNSLYIQQDGRPSFALACSLRLWATPTRLRKSASRLAYSGFQLSSENEKTAMQFLLKSCHDALKELPASAEEDEVAFRNIDNVLGGSFLADPVSRVLFPCELSNVLGENYSPKDASVVLPPKKTRSLERTRLALQWRLVYKRTLLSCISYCMDAVKCPEKK